MKLRNVLTALFATASVLPGYSKVSMPAIFSNGMVLQQLSDASIWGATTKHGGVITITTSWNNKKYTVKAGSDGTWRTKVHTPKYGGPYKITISDGEVLTLSDVEIGEVWLCSGQSNMEMRVWGRQGGDNMIGAMDAIVAKEHPEIRIFNVGHKGAGTPQTDCQGNWKGATTENIADFSATAFFFAKKLNEVLDGVPIGLVHSSVGGSVVQAWMSKESLQPWNGDEKINNRSGLYNGMIAPLVGYTIKGAIWYQGEANRETASYYTKLFSTMVADWRQKWGEGEFPFYFAQIAPFNYNSKNDGMNENSAYLREAQVKSLDVIPNSGMAILMDIGDSRTIHPANKEEVGKRFAYLALGKTYGKKGFPTTGPIYKEMRVNGKEVELFFDNVGFGLTTMHEHLGGFQVAGEDKQFYNANARLGKDKKTVIVTSDRVPNPVAVRYAFKDYVKGTLYNIYGLPASSFRTDNW
jgi:sialate O-acetylesterase